MMTIIISRWFHWFYCTARIRTMWFWVYQQEQISSSMWGWWRDKTMLRWSSKKIINFTDRWQPQCIPSCVRFSWFCRKPWTIPKRVIIFERILSKSSANSSRAQWIWWLANWLSEHNPENRAFFSYFSYVFFLCFFW